MFYLLIKEVNKRKDDIESLKVTLISGDEVFRKIANRLKKDDLLLLKDINER
jgi:isopentenyl phosphate kinase